MTAAENPYEFRKIGSWIQPRYQAVAVVLLFMLTAFHCFLVFRSTGKIYGYPNEILFVASIVMFAPLYEELIFRGAIMGQMLNKLKPHQALIWSSLLFGLWHFKNIFFKPIPDLAFQMLYTGLFVGPIAGFLRIKTGNIWPAVIFHYLNNLTYFLLQYGGRP